MLSWIILYFHVSEQNRETYPKLESFKEWAEEGYSTVSG